VEKDKREVITRDSIKAELLPRYSKGIKASIIHLIALPFICILVCYLMSFI